MTVRLAGFIWLAVVASALVISGCGGGDGGRASDNPTSQTGSTTPGSRLPDSPLVPGDIPPAFVAVEAGGSQVALIEVLERGDRTVLVFYRGIF